LIESFIDGREITVPIIGNKAYSIVEIIPSHDFYDYECKYTKGMSEYICPAELGINLSESIKDQALKVHKILDCRHYSRVDFILDKNNDPWFLEINTLPGMTETSLLPKSLKASGVEFKDVIQKIINEAINSPRFY
jgi:D-alanine-D-alanine ligase and related ATP-grasp enzymes